MLDLFELLQHAYCDVSIVVQYGKTLYDNYKRAVKKAGLSRQANQGTVQSAAPAGPTAAGTNAGQQLKSQLLLSSLIISVAQRLWQKTIPARNCVVYLSPITKLAAELSI